MTLYELTKSIELLSPSDTQFVWDYGVAFERACFHEDCYSESGGIYFNCAIHSDIQWEILDNEYLDAFERERNQSK